jgi:predicted RecB family nuclease
VRTTAERLSFSPSDVNDFLECEYLTALGLRRARGELDYSPPENAQAHLIQEKGAEHEEAYLALLEAAGNRIARIHPVDSDWDFGRAVAETVEAMHEGADVIYQAALELDGWRGIADFLERQPDGTYEAADTKLARHVKPYFLLQLCFYSEALARLQHRPPTHMHVVLGTQARETYRVSDFDCYYRRVRARFLAFVRSGSDPYPLPNPHCDICEFKALCEERWAADDHLTLVAGLRRLQAKRLESRGIATLERLAAATLDERPVTMQPGTFEALRDQATLQLLHRRTGEHAVQLLPPEAARGFALLPRPSPGDLFFDIEGDPFWRPDRGLEYLWGITELRDGSPVFRAYWAHDTGDEKRALEAVVDLIAERLAADPGMHVYHYASYETTALKRLMSEYGTREEEIDDLLRRRVFVDLFKVVRQALRHSHPRYSLKNVETFFMTREAELQAGDDSILLYERWREEHDPSILDEIHAYNEEDCLATLQLRDWLLGLRADAEREHDTEIPWLDSVPEPEEREGYIETAALREAMLEGLSEDPSVFEAGERERWLAAQLLDYHRREARPVWWAFFAREGRTPEELIEADGDAIGGIEPDGPPIGSGESLVWPFTFPPQEHKLSAGKGVYDPATLTWAGTIDSLDDERGRLGLRRGSKLEDAPVPRSLIPGGPLKTRVQQEALVRLAESILAGDDRYPALDHILRRDPPRIAGIDVGMPLPQDDLSAAKSLVERLDASYLMVQGPPGSGKTYTGARLIVDLIAKGRRVGVTATSHKAIHNLLDEVERVAAAEHVVFRGLKKGDEYEGAFVHTSSDQDDFSSPEDDVLLLAGTSWLFSRGDMAGAGIDTLFVDEAGQVSLADALASGTNARNLVLLGDPQQLAQVSQGRHPIGADASVLEHLLADDETVPPERGLFLGVTWRMHPDVCAFVSDTSYEGRLHAAPPCARQGTSFGTGLRFLAVEHEGNRGSSVEEADRIAAELERVLAGTWTDSQGVIRSIGPSDVLVVAPYNAQVRCLRARLPAEVRVGTVDKFQGQEAPIVFFSMASSSGEDVPRNVEFLFSRNRLNVAISRAQCLAYLVASPRLLEINCRTVEQMRLANALCRFVETAEPG